jgi:hypothetical protein
MARPNNLQIVFAILFALLVVTVGLIGIESWNESRKSRAATPASTTIEPTPAPDAAPAQTAPEKAKPDAKNPKQPAPPKSGGGQLYNM